MPQSDDKSRGISAREASRLRATLGSEPSSGYAFHDTGRVERVRPRGHDSSPAQIASHAPHAGTFQHTLMGVTVQEALAACENTAANDQEERSASSQSWPPLPQVPNELEGALQPEAGSPSIEASTPVTPVLRAPSTPAASSTTPPVGVAGGAIWQALPSVVEASGVSESPALPAESEAAGLPGSPGTSRPNSWRSSVADLEAEHGSAYGDARVAKYETLVERTAWEQLHTELSREPELSPVLELLRIIARRETLKEVERNHAALLSQQAIAALARLLHLPESSPTALLLGKRLLRKNPGWGRARTPSTGLSASMLLAGIAAGAGIGWLVTRLVL